MQRQWLLCVLSVCVMILGGSLGWAQDVRIIPLGGQEGEFCVGDRALLFEDPTGVRILTDPGRTVRGSADPRIAPLGSVHVVLVSHAHTDIIGNVYDNNCAQSSTSPLLFPTEGNATEIAARQNSAVLVGGEPVAPFYTQKILNINGTAPAVCPADGLDNVLTVPRTSPCIGGIVGGTRTASIGGQPGVKITTIPAVHGAGVARAMVDPPNVPLGLTGSGGEANGYILRFTNGLTVLWTGDSSLIGDWEVQSRMYHPNLAVVHMGDIGTMGPDEAAFAVLNLIKPRTVIPEHANQVSTSGGKVNSGTRVERFIRQAAPTKVIVPLSGVRIICDGQGNCK